METLTSKIMNYSLILLIRDYMTIFDSLDNNMMCNISKRYRGCNSYPILLKLGMHGQGVLVSVSQSEKNKS